MNQPADQTRHQVFLSYSHNDQEAALLLRAALEQAGLTVFKDDAAIRVGDRWLEKLETALCACQSYVLLLGRDGVRRWVGAEAQVALNRNLSPHDDAQRLPIFPILLEMAQPESLPPFLALFQAVRWIPAEPLPADLLDAIRAQASRYDQAAVYEGCPFLGLTAFHQKDARLFFGRRRETLAALARLGEQHQGNPDALPTARAGCRWLQVEGNSGAGKSSLVMAGLLPLIERGALWARTGFEHWKILGPMMPGKAPLTKLAEVLEHGLIAEPAQRDTLARLRSLETGQDARALACRLRDFKAPGTAFLLVIDQFEELFTLAEDGQRQQFDALLAHALADEDCPLFLVSTVRADFLDRFERLPLLLARYNSQCSRYFLPTISQDGLREIIEQPAWLAGLDVSEITQAILKEARDEDGALPLVENALTLLWQQRQGQRLCGDSYRAADGIAGMLSSQADTLLQRLDDALPKGRRRALELLLRLTRVHDQGRHSRQRITWEDALLVAGADAHAEPLLHWLAGTPQQTGAPHGQPGSLRLITIATEGPPDAPQGFVDLIHETLIRARGRDDKTGKAIGYWPTLYDYIEANRDRDLLRQQLRHDAKRWQGSRFLGCWWHLASLAGWLRYRPLALAQKSLEQRFLRWSLVSLVAQISLSLTVMGVFAEAALWANENKLPPSYILWKPLWWLGYVPLPEMVDIKPPAKGSFVMGCQPERDTVEWRGGDTVSTRGCEGETSPRPQALTQAYALGKYEISFLQYDYFIWRHNRGIKDKGQKRAYPSDSGWGRGDMPVINISWHDAQAYLTWLNIQQGLDCTGQCYRLPTEAEWEYAARGGRDEQADSPYGWAGKRYDPSQVNCENGSPLPIARASGVSNGFGLQDMVGNVWEWTNTKENGDQTRVLRGGAWSGYPGNCRAARRNVYRPDDRYASIGFRVCRVSPIEPLAAGALNTGRLGR